MIEGTFDVAIETPKHHKRGTMALQSAGDNIAVRVNVSDLEPLDFKGTCDGKDFTVEGTGEIPGLGTVDYHASGNVWGNSVTVNCETSAGKIEIFGTRLSASTGGFQSSHDYMMRASTGEFDDNDNTMYSGLYADGG